LSNARPTRRTQGGDRSDGLASLGKTASRVLAGLALAASGVAPSLKGRCLAVRELKPSRPRHLSEIPGVVRTAELSPRGVREGKPVAGRPQGQTWTGRLGAMAKSRRLARVAGKPFVLFGRVWRRSQPGNRQVGFAIVICNGGLSTKAIRRVGMAWVG
jgi:hypothetical protein